MNEQHAKEVIDWHTGNGGFCHTQGHRHHALRLLHEAVELCLVSGADYGEIAVVCSDEVDKHVKRHGPERTIIPVAMFEEVADVAILLEVFVHHLALSIDDAVHNKLHVLLRRRWNVDENGVLWRRLEERAAP